MSDDNFFNQSINDLPETGFATSYVDVSGVAAVGNNYAAAPGGDQITITLPPASVGEGAVVVIAVADDNSDVNIAPDSTVPDTANNNAGSFNASVQVYTFISDGVKNWTYTS